MIKELIQGAMDVYRSFGLAGILLFVAFVALAFVCVKVLDVVVKKFGESKFVERLPFLRKHARKMTPRDHTIFKKYDVLLDRIPHARIHCPLRKRIFTRLLTIRVETHKRQLEEFVEHFDASVDHDAFKISISVLLTRSHSTLARNLADAAIPQIVIRGFDAKIHDIKLLGEALVFDVCDSVRFYEDNGDKLNTIFEILATLESCVVVTVERFMDEMNGELNGTEFDGVRCTNCTSDCDFKNSRMGDGGNKIRSVLYVEDSTLVSRPVSRMFKLYGVNVFVSKSIESAREFLETQPRVDFAVVDYYMGDGVGSDLEPVLEGKKIPYVYYTGGDVAGIRAKAKVVPKSVKPDELLARMNGMVK